MTFLYSQFSQNLNKKIQLNHYNTLGRLVFVHFLGELKTSKRHFEINWPLKTSFCYSWKKSLNWQNIFHFILLKVKLFKMSWKDTILFATNWAWITDLLFEMHFNMLLYKNFNPLCRTSTCYTINWLMIPN